MFSWNLLKSYIRRCQSQIVLVLLGCKAGLLVDTGANVVRTVFLDVVVVAIWNSLPWEAPTEGGKSKKTPIGKAHGGKSEQSIHWKDPRGRKIVAAIWNSLDWEAPRGRKSEKSTHWEAPRGEKSWPWRPGLRIAATGFEIEMQRCTNVTQTNTCIVNYFVLIWNHAQLQCKIARVRLSCYIQKLLSAPVTNQVKLRCGRPPQAKRGEYWIPQGCSSRFQTRPNCVGTTYRTTYRTTSKGIKTQTPVLQHLLLQELVIFLSCSSHVPFILFSVSFHYSFGFLSFPFHLLSPTSSA